MGTAAQLARQQASNRKMRGQGYRTYVQPLYVSDDAEAVIRSLQETLRRAMILWLLGCCADGTPHAEIRASMERCGLLPDLSPAEAEYMATPFHDEQTDVNMKWSLESSWVLLWALKRLWWLNSPESLCGCGRMAGILRKRGCAHREFSRACAGPGAQHCGNEHAQSAAHCGFSAGHAAAV